ncbi:MAG: glycine/betaine ABC transporter substrate-binding protein [Clostridiales Family XIII bacterium]|jgi:osmoprotectant transport system substrate-binding protein|nr:glycine/betaine ABC transporter substrate-binding protein [Clostridiales Family XIII bacterium]
MKFNKTNRKYSLLALALAIVLAAAALAGCSGSGSASNGSSAEPAPAPQEPSADSGNQGAGDKSITVGSKNFAENQIVARIIQYALEDSGYKVSYIDNLEGDVLQAAIETGEIDLYPEYTNTGLTRILHLDPIFDTQEAYDTVKEKYAETYNIKWLEPSSVNNTYTLVVSKKTADGLGLKTFSDLQAVSGEIRAAQGWDWNDRPDILPALEATYGPFNFKDATIYSGKLTYQVLLSDEGDLTIGYTTDPELEDENLVSLADDKQVWPPYNLVPIVKQEALDKYPDIEDIINKITKTLSTEKQIQLNADVVTRHEEVEDVARAYYEENIK